MVAKTHMVIGLTTLAGTDALTGLVQSHPFNGIPVGPVLGMVAVMLGALAPDIDAKKSQIRYELGPAGLAISTWLKLFGVQHRGLTHYGLTTVAVIAFSSLFGWWLDYLDIGLAFGLGYSSHVLADSLTITGTPLLWPLNKKKNLHLLPRGLRLRTRGRVESFLFIGFMVMLVVLLPAYLPA